MTSVNITTTKNTVTVNGETSVVTVTTQGPQGPTGAQGPQGPQGASGSAAVTSSTVDAAGAVMNSDTTTADMSFVVDEDNMSSDSATKVPTQQSVKAYVDTEVAGIVDSAPTALNTLNELAAALGDDANFSTTVTNSIGTKLPLAGGTMTGNIVMSGSETVDGRDLSVDGAKLDTIESNATADQTASEIKTLLQSDKLTVSEIADDAITADKLANSINTEIAANTAKVSNATHTGDVTGSTALTIADDAVTYAKMQDVSATDRVLGRDSSGAGVVEEITPANLRTMINVEDGATADQTDAEIKTAYENNSDTNAFTDAEKTKLSGVEANATADQTDEEIQDIVGAMLTGNTESGITVTYQDADGTIDFAVASQTDENFTTADHSKLDGIESNATADQTGAEIKSLYEGESDTNAFTDADHTKLDGIEASADVTDATNVDAAGAVMNSDLDGKGELLVGDGSGDPTALAAGTDGYVLKANSSTATGLEWSAAGSGGDTNQNAFSNVAVSGQDTVAADSTTDTLNIAAGSNVTITTNASNDTVTIASTDTNTTYSVGDGGLTQNNFTDALKTKLDGIEASADVTDATNVAAAGALMDGDFTSNGFLKRTGAGSYTVDTNTYLTSVPSGYLQNLSEDTTPQLGGDLDMNSNFISSGILGIKNTGSQSEIRLYCESNNAHYASIKAPAHADFSGDITFTLPSGYGSNGQVLQSNGSGGTSWVAQTTAYTNSSVDSHLNTSSASSGQILSWNGSDYAWVADQTGGGGGGSGISNLVEDTTPQLGGNLDMQANNISGTGTIIANSTAVATAGMRKIYASSSAPTGSDGAVGDLWVKF
jgi:hypothetical protein